MREITLILHFLGLGLLVSSGSAGIILNRQYKNAEDLRTKALILRAAKPIGLLSPTGMLIMIITGIGNMHFLGVGILDLGWLSAKLVVFAVAMVIGIWMGVVSRKRGALVGAMAAGQADPNADQKLAAFDRLVVMGYIVLPLLLVVIIYLSVYGRLGGQ
jgi:hypothetical protein